MGHDNQRNDSGWGQSPQEQPPSTWLPENGPQQAPAREPKEEPATMRWGMQITAAVVAVVFIIGLDLLASAGLLRTQNNSEVEPGPIWLGIMVGVLSGYLPFLLHERDRQDNGFPPATVSRIMVTGPLVVTGGMAVVAGYYVLQGYAGPWGSVGGSMTQPLGLVAFLGTTWTIGNLAMITGVPAMAGFAKLWHALGWAGILIAGGIGGAFIFTAPVQVLAVTAVLGLATAVWAWLVGHKVARQTA